MSNVTDFYVRESSELNDFKCDQTVIVRRKFLPQVTHLNYKEDAPTWRKALQWNPKCNSYYPYLEDSDALNRKEILQDVNLSELSSTSSLIEPETFESDAYSERDAQNNYLSSNPFSFVLLGKPGIGEQELGKLLADHWKCVYIDPETLIQEEIYCDTRAGQCIEFNLRCGRAISADVIMRLVEKRIRSKTAQHRGFVLCGFPLISNDLFEEDPVSSESAIFNVQEIFEDFIEAAIPADIIPPTINVTQTSLMEENEEIEGEVSVVDEKVPVVENKYEIPMDIGSASINICAPPDPYRNVEEQLNYIFSLLTLPYIVVYIACNNSEVVAKHSEYRYDVDANKLIDLQKEEVDKLIYSTFSNNPTQMNDLPEGFIYLTKFDNAGIDYSSRYNMIKLPRDFPSSVVTQLEKYRFEAMDTIERHVLQHDPQYVIHLDGRISAARMFYALKMRLDVLPLQKVLVPEKLNVPQEPTGAEGEVIEELNLEGMTPADCFEIFCRKQISSPMFKWSWSDWGARCPVSMAEGIHVDGDPKYAVQFMNKMFFLVDEIAFLKFYRNPRPYLLPPFPKSSSKIFVIGPKQTAKEAVSKCLGYLMDVSVLIIRKLQNECLKQKQAEFVENVRCSATNEIMTQLTEERLEEHAQKENKRLETIETWKLTNLKLLHYYVKKTTEMPIEPNAPPPPAEGEGEAEVKTSEEDLLYDKKIRLQSIEDIINQLEKNNITFYENAEEVEEMLNNPEKILEHALDLPFTPNIYEAPDEQEEIVINFAENAAENADLSSVELTIEDLMEMYIKAIKDLEEESEENSGWIIAGMPANAKLLEALKSYFADEVFILIDSSEDHQFLMDRYRFKGLAEFTDFRNLFLDLDKKDAAMRAPSILSTESYKQRVASDILKTILEECAYYQGDEEGEEEETEDEYYKYHPRRAEIDAYRETLDEFDQNIEAVKELFEEMKISVTEVDISYKSLRTLLSDIVNVIDNRYMQPATVLTDDDREDELKDFGEPVLIPDEEEGEEGEPEPPGEDSFMKNRRYGDTYHFCPIAFNEKFVLWRGKEELGVKFESKLYFMHNEEALKKFTEDPKKYLFKNHPPQLFPPPRICITGPPGSGKTTFSRKLCTNLGLFYGNYMDLLKKVNIEEVTPYIESNEPLSEDILNDVLPPFWFQEPQRSIGFVLDGFPRRTFDVDYMLKNLTIPDVIIELTAIQPILYERLLNLALEAWKIKIAEEQANQGKINAQLMKDWEAKKKLRINELMEQKREERYAARMTERENVIDENINQPSQTKEVRLVDVQETDDGIIRVKSQISYESVAEQADLEEVKKIVFEEIPPPQLLETWETIEEATERIGIEIEETLNLEGGFTENIREFCDTELIPWVPVDANLSFDKIFAQIMKVADPIKFRNGSMFERCYDISLELAETLLSSGYYFLSIFGRTCPVQYYEKHHTFQMYLSQREKFLVYPVISRQYIYFLIGRKNRDKFRSNPLLYTSLENFSFPLISYRVSIIGPPKCGKSALAERFTSELGLKHISIGKACRYVESFLPYTDLAKSMQEVLRKGWEITSEMEMRCVEAMCLEATAVAQGCVFDGFPNSKDEKYHLAELGLTPHLVIDLVACDDLICQFAASDPGKRGIPAFSKQFIQHRHEVWNRSQETYRKWLDRKYQILAKIPVQPCKWGVWHASYELAAGVLSEIKFYFTHADHDLVLRLGHMQVSHIEFSDRKSSYKNYCPGCLCDTNALNCGGNPPDRTGLVQFKYYFYWFCEKHLEKFIKNPDQYLSPYNPNVLPEHLPVKTSYTERPIDPYEGGLCIVCYADNAPERVFRDGLKEFGVEYRDKIYLFDCEECREKFMSYCGQYFSKTISFKGCIMTDLSFKNFPTLGYLQQYDARQIIKAITNASVNRPLICGLSIDASAALNIGLFLKANNPKTPAKILPIFENALQVFNERRSRFSAYLTQRKNRLNPYLHYEEPLKPLKLSEDKIISESESSSLSMFSLVDEMLNRINY